MKKRMILLMLMTALAVWLTGCGGEKGNSATEAGTTGEAKEVYIVGSHAAFAPFEFMDHAGNVQGFDVDVLEAIAAEVGIQVQFENTAWESIFVSLENGERDILASGITITDERKQSMDFTEPYFVAKQYIAVSKDSEIETFAELSELQIGVQNSTTGDLIVSDYLGVDSQQIHRYESVPLAMMDLNNGLVDAVVADNAVVLQFIKNNPGYELKLIEDPAMEQEEYGFAVKKGNAELLDQLNQGLKAIQENGTYDEIFEKYFGESAE